MLSKGINMPKPLSNELVQMQKKIENVAKSYGLDFFDCYYEMLDFDEMNMVASYGGFPVRYPHWKWGMEYERLKKSHEYGLSKIYEMVINNDPCYAYLMDSNSLVDQKIVMCHVTGHNDFFKNNLYFSNTNRKMINEMGNHAVRIRRYMDWFGVNEVENFIDCALSLENLIDINLLHKAKKNFKEQENVVPKEVNVFKLPNEKHYMDRYINPESFLSEQRQKLLKEQEEQEKKFPIEPVADVLGFLIAHAPLKRWQADILEIIRKEAYYYAPQAATKIMNEGWASYWHAKLMTNNVMDAGELIDFADRHSGVMVCDPRSLNPYKIGIELFRDIEERWNKGKFGSEYDHCDDMNRKLNWDKNLSLGMEKIFQVRKIYCDLTFIDEFLTLEFCQRNNLFSFSFDKRKQDYVIESRDFSKIKQKLLKSLTNFGQPQIRVINGNFENRYELLLEHVFDGVELDFSFAKETLKNLRIIWDRPVHLLTKIEDRDICLSHDGENYKENILVRQV